MEKVPIFDAQHLTSIAKILADTEDGLTGSQIGYLLQDCEIPDIASDQTKWKRLFNAFIEFQNRRQFGNHVVVFVNKAMNPVQYTSSPQVFATRRDQLNAVLSFSGLSVGEDGKIRWVRRATGLDEALQRSGRRPTVRIQLPHHPVLHFSDISEIARNPRHLWTPPDIDRGMEKAGLEDGDLVFLTTPGRDDILTLTPAGGTYGFPGVCAIEMTRERQENRPGVQGGVSNFGYMLPSLEEYERVIARVADFGGRLLTRCEHGGVLSHGNGAAFRSVTG
jgi:hypothetical protein